MPRELYPNDILNIEARNGYVSDQVVLTRDEWLALKNDREELHELFEAEESFENQLATAEEQKAELSEELESEKTKHEETKDMLKYAEDQVEKAKEMLEKYSIDLIDDIDFLKP